MDHYPQVNRACLREMRRQVGDLLLDDDGMAVRGLIVRHLVLPGGRAGTEDLLRFIAEELGTNTYVNLMDQYRPCYRASEIPGLDRPLGWPEFRAAREVAKALGLVRLAG